MLSWSDQRFQEKKKAENANNPSITALDPTGPRQGGYQWLHGLQHDNPDYPPVCAQTEK